MGYTEQEWEQVHALFGTGDEYAQHAASDEDSHEPETVKQVTLQDVYEPSEVQEKMFTQRDDEIRSEDWPERYQLAGIVKGGVDDAEALEEETQWIGEQLTEARHAANRRVQNFAIASTSLLICIGRVLKLIYHEGCDIPFIMRHRRDLYHREIVN